MIIRFLRPLLIGILLFLVINIPMTLLLTFHPTLNQAMNAKVDNYLPKKLLQLQAIQPKRLDILALGTSQTNNDFSTQAFESVLSEPVNTYNLGLPGTRYDVMKAMLMHQIREGQKPGTVLLELSDPLVEDQTVYYYLPALHYRTLIERDPGLLGRIWANPTMAPEVRQEVVLASWSSFYQFRSIFAPLGLPKKIDKTWQALSQRIFPVAMAAAPPVPVVPEFKPSEAMIAKGWYPKPMSPKMLLPGGPQKVALAAKAYYLDPMKGVNFGKLDDLIAYCRQQHIEVLLVQWPNDPEYDRFLNQADMMPAFRAELSRVIARYDVPYIDLNAYRPEKTTGLFADSRHLTPAGAAYFSKALARDYQALQNPYAYRIDTHSELGFIPAPTIQ